MIGQLIICQTIIIYINNALKTLGIQIHVIYNDIRFHDNSMNKLLQNFPPHFEIMVELDLFFLNNLEEFEKI